ncbi:alpha/beta hydrolase family protein [Fulvivirga sedimenti]|uniref:Alpha/beta fold hydrolase n=1 Tax=Fulvivirga sedimenti TaxID=2879465 RepID=A0A9X1HKI8_9BACT|nr:alpha/beta fold hydrolase [Fulvivirga sedimenti]MCA6073858.1 alpha/beta fold hydrolase [Fulvivirga sedimenti]
MKLFKEVILKGSEHGRLFTVDISWKTTKSRKPVIVFVHGFKGFKDWGTFPKVADYFADNDYVFVKMNLSHNGVSPESPIDYDDLNAFSENTFTKELQDIRQVVDFIQSQNLPVPSDEADTNQIFMLGHSRGAAVALLHSSMDDRIRRVCGWGAVVDLESRWPEHLLKIWKQQGVMYIPNSRTGQDMPMKYDIVEDYFENRKSYHIPSALERIKAPVLLIHGTADETVPFGETSAVLKKLKNSEHIQFSIIDDANHVFGASHPYSQPELPEHTETMIHMTNRFFRTGK